MKKEEKGITLVALVVTIIVLLILAGIAISLTIGNNGLFSRAKNAVDVWNETSKKEENEIGDFIGVFDNTVNEINEVGTPKMRTITIKTEYYNEEIKIETTSNVWDDVLKEKVKTLAEERGVFITGESGNSFWWSAPGNGMTYLQKKDADPNEWVVIGDIIDFDQEYILALG